MSTFGNFGNLGESLAASVKDIEAQNKRDLWDDALGGLGIVRGHPWMTAIGVSATVGGVGWEAYKASQARKSGSRRVS